jgi:hypothetical protein
VSHLCHIPFITNVSLGPTTLKGKVLHRAGLPGGRTMGPTPENASCSVEEGQEFVRVEKQRGR